ncbi:MAG TPA: FtsQ-type POTRA domain-containing protein [Gemmatimonadaceae bacterium]
MTESDAPLAAANDPPRPRHRRWRRALVLLGLTGLVTVRWWGPPIFRHLDFFRVRHVEVHGARYTPPHELVELLDADTSMSVWDDLTPLRARVAKHPQVAHAEVTARLPATLVITVEEYVPVALAPTRSGLRAYDRAGRLLPLDPSRTPVDVPILARRDTMLLRLLDDIRNANPAFFARISEAQRLGRDDVRLSLVTVPVRIRPDIDLERLAQVSSVEADLARRGVRAAELDLRFRDQVIARFP